MVLSRLMAVTAGLVGLLACSAPASALITDPKTIDGPSGSVLDLGGVAMAEDGTGGAVYRKLEGGRAHIFVSQFVDGDWQPPRRVDVGQNFDSSWPRIGAGSGGRLVVTWVQEFGPGSDRMFSATLDPDARRFQSPVPVDLNVGEATATYPSLAMSRGGQAYLVYRVVSQGSNLPPGYVLSDTRIARYGGSLWTVLGSLADRNPAAPTRTPTQANSPKVDIDLTGPTGIVAFQEPDDEFVDRVWARRIFGSSLGVPLIVSPQSFDSAPLRGPADAFDLDVAGFGQGAIALRQRPGEGGRLGSTRVFVNLIAESSVEGSDKFTGPRLADGGALGGEIGPPSVSVTGASPYMVGFGAGAATLSTEGDDGGARQSERLDAGGSTIPGDPEVELSDSKAAVGAWREGSGGRAVVAVQERTASGVPEVRSMRASAGGPVNSLELAGSGLGDGLVAFHQGGQSFGQIGVAAVDAPPVEILLSVPDGYVRGRRTRIRWAPAINAGPVRYSVAVDDEAVRERLRGTTAVLTPRELPEGRHRIEVIAEDKAGQETVSRPGRVRVDRRRPTVRLRRRGRLVRVSVSGGTSGLRRGSTRIVFGDGSRPSRRARAGHVYRRAGSFLVTVSARDRAGHRTRYRKRVRIR